MSSAWNFEVVAYESEHYCVGCLPDGVTVGDEFVYPITALAEVDCWPVCCKCRAEHDYMSLTSEGRRWNSRREWSDKVRALAESESDGKLPAYASPGGYPIVYTGDAGCYCPTCANDTGKCLALLDYGVHWEGDPIACEECGEEIASAYGPTSNSA